MRHHMRNHVRQLRIGQNEILSMPPEEGVDIIKEKLEKSEFDLSKPIIEDRDYETGDTIFTQYTFL